MDYNNYTSSIILPATSVNDDLNEIVIFSQALIKP